ncbi:MAG: hypothetical protein SCM11_12235 [Bacillota bacterium]|nr:hypothetical protein [Bacillota bacterium]
MFLYHYFDETTGPFVNLSDIPVDEAKAVLDNIKKHKPNVQCALRQPTYMEDRYYYEDILRTEFTKKGGIIKRKSPHYMVVEHSPWLSTWFNCCSFIKISIAELDLKTVSFTYGDSHPTFSPRPRADDWKEYRRQLYSYEEILLLIEKYGLPQIWNNDGTFGPERYIEAHIWSDETIDRYRTNWRSAIESKAD